MLTKLRAVATASAMAMRPGQRGGRLDCASVGVDEQRDRARRQVARLGSRLLRFVLGELVGPEVAALGGTGEVGGAQRGGDHVRAAQRPARGAGGLADLFGVDLVGRAESDREHTAHRQAFGRGDAGDLFGFALGPDRRDLGRDRLGDSVGQQVRAHHRGRAVVGGGETDDENGDVVGERGGQREVGSGGGHGLRLGVRGRCRCPPARRVDRLRWGGPATRDGSASGGWFPLRGYGSSPVEWFRPPRRPVLRRPDPLPRPDRRCPHPRQRRDVALPRRSRPSSLCSSFLPSSRIRCTQSLTLVTSCCGSCRNHILRSP